MDIPSSLTAFIAACIDVLLHCFLLPPRCGCLPTVAGADFERLFLRGMSRKSSVVCPRESGKLSTRSFPVTSGYFRKKLVNYYVAFCILLAY